MLESNLIKIILNSAKKIEGLRLIKIHGGQFSAGQPDISGCYYGTRIELECKIAPNKPTKLQAENLKLWYISGAFCAIITYDESQPLVFTVSPLEDSDFRIFRIGKTKVDLHNLIEGIKNYV